MKYNIFLVGLPFVNLKWNLKRKDMEENFERNDLYSKAIRAGKRTYFFDVKSTRSDNCFLTITESKKRFSEADAKFFYEKHKIFLYREDFEKFIEGLQEAIDFIKKHQPEYVPRKQNYAPDEDMEFDQ